MLLVPVQVTHTEDTSLATPDPRPYDIDRQVPPVTIDDEGPGTPPEILTRADDPKPSRPAPSSRAAPVFAAAFVGLALGFWGVYWLL